MEPYARVFLSFATERGHWCAGGSVHLLHTADGLTRQLAVRDPTQALERAAASTSDWTGGTRFAEIIRPFVDEHSRRGLAQGAVIVILSDGWALDDPSRSPSIWHG